ncbi:MAG: VWA domain-containing protein [Candidatus Zixiibacteriota bacterium]|jgi:Ca-activated chloride channel family protein
MKNALILILGIACGAASLAGALEPPPSVAAEAPKDYKDAAIAVLPFVNESNSTRLDYLETALAKMLITDLKQAGHLTVVTRDNLDDVLAELKLDRSALVDPTNAQKIGKILGADLIVAGSLVSVSGSLRLDAHVIDVATAEIVAASKVEGAGENEALKMVDTLAMSVISDLTGETIVLNSYDPLHGRFDPAHTSEALTFWPILGNEYGLVGTAATAYLELKFRAADIPVEVAKDRPPLNLCLVIDRSGSMGSSGKLDYVKEAAKYVVDNLGPQDRISIVAFDSDVKVVHKNSKVENKSMLNSKIDELFAGTNTNLSGGLEEGYSQAKKGKKKNYLNRVVLLSDGLANEGITDLEKLSSIARNWQKKDIYTTAMGVGTDYDDHLLTLIATGGAGNYYYIDQPNTIPNIFARELSGIVNVAASGIAVDVMLEPGVKIAKVHGYQYTDMGNGRYEIAVGDIASGQEYTVFIELSLPAVEEEKTVSLGTVAVRYEDQIKKKAVSSTATRLAMHFVPQEEVVAANEVAEVVNTAYVMENAAVMEEARRMVSEGKRDEAKGLLEEQKKKSRDRAADGLSQELINSANELEELEVQADDEDEYSDAALMKAAGAAANETQYH